MPNWCSNHLFVSASPEVVETIAILCQQSSNGQWSLAPVVIPPKFDYQENLSIWGTKWDTDSHLELGSIPLHDEPRFLKTRLRLASEFLFDTADAPPHRWFPELVKRFPDATLAMSSNESSNGIHVLYGGCDGEYSERDLADATWDDEYGDPEDEEDDEDDCTPDGEKVLNFEYAKEKPDVVHRVRSNLDGSDRQSGLEFVCAFLEAPAEHAPSFIAQLGQDLNACVKGTDWPLLFFAAQAGRPDLVETLLEAGADPLVKTRHGLGLLDICLQPPPNCNSYSVSKELDADNQLRQSRLIECMLTALQVAPRLAKQPLISGMTPLEYACARIGGNSHEHLPISVIEALISAGGHHVSGSICWGKTILEDAFAQAVDYRYERGNSDRIKSPETPAYHPNLTQDLMSLIIQSMGASVSQRSDVIEQIEGHPEKASSPALKDEWFVVGVKRLFKRSGRDAEFSDKISELIRAIDRQAPEFISSHQTEVMYLGLKTDLVDLPQLLVDKDPGVMDKIKASLRLMAEKNMLPTGNRKVDVWIQSAEARQSIASILKKSTAQP